MILAQPISAWLHNFACQWNHSPDVQSYQSCSQRRICDKNIEFCFRRRRTIRVQIRLRPRAGGKLTGHAEATVPRWPCPQGDAAAAPGDSPELARQSEHRRYTGVRPVSRVQHRLHDAHRSRRLLMEPDPRRCPLFVKGVWQLSSLQLRGACS